MITYNIEDPYVAGKMAKAVFLDIETSLVDARVFRTGQQMVTAEQLSGFTYLLTASWGSMYDLYTKGIDGVQSIGNHYDSKTFKNNPLDDTLVLRALWDVLDDADVILAHNAKFDTGWMMGRFLQLGWPLPSKFSTICTYTALTKFSFVSKKLDMLSKQLIGSRKIPTNLTLWMNCSDGDIEAFKEMETYNRGDVFDTLFKVYLMTCKYYPDYCVDMADYSLEIPLCKVSGEPLEPLERTWFNRRNGLEYSLYYNDTLGITYRDRYHADSNKAGLGLIRHHV